MANKAKPLDWAKIELFLKAGAKQNKIAESLGIHSETLRNQVKAHYGEDYADVCASFRTTGEILIEVAQFQKALKGNVQMLIWLGKIRCGQTEPEVISSIPPHQHIIDVEHDNMRLKNELAQLREKLGADGHQC